MLGIILTYYSFPEMLQYQLKNFEKHVKTPYKVFVVDDSPQGLSLPSVSSDKNVIYLKSSVLGSTANPSTRHQNAVNNGMNIAQYSCDTFLIFDNDMIFITDFYLPQKPWWLPIDCPSFRKGISDDDTKYPWFNLLYIEHFHYFEYYKNSDSGGSILPYLRDADIITHETTDNILLNEYITKYKELSNEYTIEPYQELLQINNALVYHFRAMSNYTSFPKDYMEKKKQLILSYLNQL